MTVTATRVCTCHGVPMLRRTDRGWRCRIAQREASARWAEAHPDRRVAAVRRSNWKRAGIDITVEQFAALLAEQDGRCGICATSDPGSNGWHADHDHETGRVRGVLCGDCNRGLGLLGDDADGLTRALAYLLAHESAGTVEGVKR